MVGDLEGELLRVAARLPGSFTRSLLCDALERVRARLADPSLAHLVDSLLAWLVERGYLEHDGDEYALAAPGWVDVEMQPTLLIDDTPPPGRDDAGLAVVERAISYVQRG
jgi:hypothetical protein